MCIVNWKIFENSFLSQNFDHFSKLLYKKTALKRFSHKVFLTEFIFFNPNNRENNELISF